MSPSASDTPSRPERPRPVRLPFWAGVAVLAVAVLAVGAAVVGPRVPVPVPDRVCPAIGYSSLLEVTLTGDASEVAQVQVHVGEAWQPPFPEGADRTSPAIMSSRDGDTWSFTLYYPPNPMALRALDAEGDVVAQTERDVDWIRVGGNEECGGPMQGRVDWAI